MDLVTYNIDHPTHGSKRFNPIRTPLLTLSPDLLILTEANTALTLPGYTAVFSEESPYLRRGRNMDPPNRYHQVGISAKGELRKLEEITDSNGVAAEINGLRVYGCVFTIKDRWAAWSDKTYTDRVREQSPSSGNWRGLTFSWAATSILGVPAPTIRPGRSRSRAWSPRPGYCGPPATRSAPSSTCCTAPS